MWVIQQFMNTSSESSVVSLAIYESKGQEHLRRTLLAFPSSQTVKIWRSYTITRTMTTNTDVSWTNLLAAPAVHGVGLHLDIAGTDECGASH